jgi:pimeloyl-ACP methyl ester carboxylesterase
MERLTRDGTAFAFEDVGSGSPLLFVHGWACNHNFFAPQIDHFSRFHRVIAPDLCGHGASDAPRRQYTVAEFANDLAWLCGELRMERAVVVGHSMGGVIALELAARHRELAAAICLIDSVVFQSDAFTSDLKLLGDQLAGTDYLRVLQLAASALFADWDFYASESGDQSWGYEAVLDLYRQRVEAWAGIPDPEYRGVHGTVHVQPAVDPAAFAFALLEGAESVGLEGFPNPNGRMMESAGGCALIDETVRDGKRQSIFRSYLYPLMDQPNLTVLSGALARRILFDRRRAIGVELHYQGKTVRAEAAREVILSLGAIHTPKLLMQSGIGDEAELKRAGIRVLQALAGVGRNLHDHVGFGVSWENTDRLPAPIRRSQTACFWKTSPELSVPNFYAFALQGPLATPEGGPIQSPGCLLVPFCRHAAEESRHDSPDRTPSQRFRKDRRELPWRFTGPEGSGGRLGCGSRDW